MHGLTNLSELSKLGFEWAKKPSGTPRRNAPLRAAVSGASAARVNARQSRPSPTWANRRRERKRATDKFKSGLALTRNARRAAAHGSRNNVNIDELIARADAAANAFNRASTNTTERKIKRAEFYRTRNAVIHQIERRAQLRNKRVGEILRNISRRKNQIVANINWSNVSNRYMTWRQTIAREQGGKPPHTSQTYRGELTSPRTSPLRSPRRRTPNWARQVGGVSGLARALARRGL